MVCQGLVLRGQYFRGPFYLAPKRPPSMVPAIPLSKGPNNIGKTNPPRCTNIFFFWRTGIFFWTIWRRRCRCLPKHFFWCGDKGIVPFKTFKQHSHTVSMTSLEADWIICFLMGGEALDRTDNTSPCLAKRGGSPFLFFPLGGEWDCFLRGDILVCLLHNTDSVLVLKSFLYWNATPLIIFPPYQLHDRQHVSWRGSQRTRSRQFLFGQIQ